MFVKCKKKRAKNMCNNNGENWHGSESCLFFEIADGWIWFMVDIYVLLEPFHIKKNSFPQSSTMAFFSHVSTLVGIKLSVSNDFEV